MSQSWPDVSRMAEKGKRTVNSHFSGITDCLDSQRGKVAEEADPWLPTNDPGLS